jgi:hypothetical protein
LILELGIGEAPCGGCKLALSPGKLTRFGEVRILRDSHAQNLSERRLLRE